MADNKNNIDDKKRIKANYITYAFTAVAWGIGGVLLYIKGEHYTLASVGITLAILCAIASAAYYRKYKDTYGEEE